MTGGPLLREPSVVDFVCADCGMNILSLGYHDGLEVCGICRFIRECPGMSDEMKAKLRGTDLQ